MIELDGIVAIDAATMIIEINDYLPLRVRTQAALLGGARSIRSGNSDTGMLDLIVSGDSMVLRGFTLTLFDRMAASPLSGSGLMDAGVPVLRTPRAGFSGNPHAPLWDSETDFLLFLGDETVEIQFAQEPYDRICRIGDVAFLLQDDRLLGIRVDHRSQIEMEILRAYA